MTLQEIKLEDEIRSYIDKVSKYPFDILFKGGMGKKLYTLSTTAAIAVLRNTTKLQVQEIADAIRHSNHTTVMYRLKIHDEMMDDSSENQLLYNPNYEVIYRAALDIANKTDSNLKYIQRDKVINFDNSKAMTTRRRLAYQAVAQLRPNRIMRILYLVDLGWNAADINKTAFLDPGMLTIILANRQQIEQNNNKLIV